MLVEVLDQRVIRDPGLVRNKGKTQALATDLLFQFFAIAHLFSAPVRNFLHNNPVRNSCQLVRKNFLRL